MQRPLLSADLRDLHQILEAAGAHDFYHYLRQRGFGFAAWVIGAANDHEVYVASPVDFLRNSPLPGICSPIFQILTKAQIDKMRIDLAKAYLRSLQKIARNSLDTRIVRDVNASEVAVLYREALERNGLSMENWNLHFPFAILMRLGGEGAVDIYWEFLRDTLLRSPHVAVVANLATVAFMYKQTMSTDTKVRRMATSWLSRNPAMDSQCTIETRFKWGLDAARHTDHEGMAEFLEALDLEGHGIQRDNGIDFQASIMPLPLRSDNAVMAPTSIDDWETELESAIIYRALMARLRGDR